MNCNKCGSQREFKPVQTCCEMTGTLITINMGYCPCKDNNDDDELLGRMIDEGERPTIAINPKDASEGFLKKVADFKKLQRFGKSIGMESTTEFRVSSVIPDKIWNNLFI